MTKAIVLGLALIAAAFIGRGYIEAAQADAGDVKTWGEFRAELVETRQALRAARSAIGQEWRQRECRFQSLRQGTWTEVEERLTAQCALSKWPATSWDNFDRIISCESGWRRTAYNPSGPYVGLGQHVLSAWSSRLRAFNPDGWELALRPRWENSRSMLVTTVRMMMGGLSPWSCA